MDKTSYYVLMVSLLATFVSPYPFRSYAPPQSVRGRLRVNMMPESLQDYISNYNADYYRNRQSQYGVPEYGPTYSAQGMQHISPEAVAALLSSLSQNDAGEYTYDTNADQNSYTDDEGTWYDDATTLGYSNNFGGFDNYDRSNQDAAILKLYLDHLNNKYSLEDLETLDREAAMEDNTENQLRAYRTQKKANRAPVRYHSSFRQIEPTAIRQNQGQKEEAYMVPATSIRKTVQQIQKQEETKEENIGNEKRASKTVSSLPKSTNKPSKSQEAETTSPSAKPETPTTMEPFVKSAYDALKKYLNNERRLRQSADEEDESKHLHRTQKRFVSDPSSLTQQLASLKKTTT